jgi:hypothetical protein
LLETQGRGEEGALWKSGTRLCQEESSALADLPVAHRDACLRLRLRRRMDEGFGYPHQ